MRRRPGRERGATGGLFREAVDGEKNKGGELRLYACDLLHKSLCANMSETSSPSTITVGRGKKSHFDEHAQDKHFIRCVGSFGA
jgi:hypothetical protein